MGAAPMAVTLAVFAIGTTLWCLAGYLLISHPRLVRWLRCAGTWLVAPLYIGFGLHILASAGLFAHL
jgi:cadmium resistance protein CadD (predicted permease)